MKQTINAEMFAEAFARFDRTDNFTRPALYALYNYLVDREEETGEEMVLDVIELCCSWCECETSEEAEEVSRGGVVIAFDGGFVVCRG